MKPKTANPGPSEYDFALIVGGVRDLDERAENALFESGCEDATLSMQYGRLYIEFSRGAASLKDAVLSAIRDVRRAGLGAEVLRVDECNLVTAAEIARRMGRTRQAVSQYNSGVRGPGGFPPPECHIAESAPLWAWCAVSFWLSQNNFIREEDCWNAEVVEAANRELEAARQRRRQPQLVAEIVRELARK